MRYLGGKSRLAKEIALLINAHPINCVYLEPFMGSCWVTCEVALRHRFAGDIHHILVALFHHMQKGWIPPEQISKEQYHDIRANRTTGKYQDCLLGFAGFGCAFAGGCWRGYAGEQYASMAKRSLLKKTERLKDVTFFNSDYRELDPYGCVIYCDPPYRNVSYGYRITGVKGNGKFDSDEFWDVVSKWSEKNIVYVSEYEAPSCASCVLERHTITNVNQNPRLERVFMMGDPNSLRPSEESTETRSTPADWNHLIDYLGVSADWVGFTKDGGVPASELTSVLDGELPRP